MCPFILVLILGYEKGWSTKMSSLIHYIVVAHPFYYEGYCVCFCVLVTLSCKSSPLKLVALGKVGGRQWSHQGCFKGPVGETLGSSLGSFANSHGGLHNFLRNPLPNPLVDFPTPLVA